MTLKSFLRLWAIVFVTMTAMLLSFVYGIGDSPSWGELAALVVVMFAGSWAVVAMHYLRMEGRR